LGRPAPGGGRVADPGAHRNGQMPGAHPDGHRGVAQPGRRLGIDDDLHHVGRLAVADHLGPDERIAGLGGGDLEGDALVALDDDVAGGFSARLQSVHHEPGRNDGELLLELDVDWKLDDRETFAVGLGPDGGVEIAAVVGLDLLRHEGHLELEAPVVGPPPVAAEERIIGLQIGQLERVGILGHEEDRRLGHRVNRNIVEPDVGRVEFQIGLDRRPDREH